MKVERFLPLTFLMLAALLVIIIILTLKAL